MTSKENAVASLSKVDPSPLLQYFSTFFLRMYCSVVYWQSYGDSAGIWKQATFLNVSKPKSMRDLRGEFCKVANFSRSICTQPCSEWKHMYCGRRCSKPAWYQNITTCKPGSEWKHMHRGRRCSKPVWYCNITTCQPCSEWKHMHRGRRCSKPA